MMKPVQILHLEDDPNDAELIRSILVEEGLKCNVTVVETEEEFMTSLQTQPPDLILADHNLPTFNGLSALQITTRDHPYIPFIIVSGMLGEERAIDAMKRGATDYVLKENLNRLPSAITRALKEVELQKERHEASKKAHLLNTVMEQAFDTVVITDITGVIQYVNPAFERISGYTQSEALGKTQAILKSGKQDDSFYEDMWETILNGDAWSGRIINKRKNGELYTEECHISPVRDKAGDITNFIAVKNDITQSLKLEEQLFLSEKMTTIAGLAAGVAHEINTPLSAILQSIQVVKNSLAEDNTDNQAIAEECGVDLNKVGHYFERQEIDFFLNGIKESAINASKIITGLLDFSRPQKGEMEIADINTLLENSLALARADYNLKKEYDILNFEIIKEFDADIPQIECVPMEIEQVILNLLKNATHAIADGEKEEKGKIVLRSMLDTDFVRIEIEDNGPGIDAAIRPYIFDPFFTTKEVGIGTGLGLSVSYAIVCEKHGGSIYENSESDNGARFVVKLPVSR